jgi:signal transduction histidine kinase/CheY-like chemotaxis protein
MRLRSQLVALVIGAILPVVAFAAVMIVLFARQQGQTLERGARETTRVLAVALDRELDGSIGALESLAASPLLDYGDLKTFRNRAERVHALRPGWSSLLLVDAAGQVVVDVSGSADGQRDLIPDPRYFSRILETGHAGVSGLVPGVRPTVSVGVPVPRGDQLKYVLVAVLDVVRLGSLLDEKELALGWSARIVDRSGTTIVSAPFDASTIGQPISASFAEAQRLNPGDWVRFRSHHGRDMYAALSRSDVSGWSVALSLPANEITSPIVRSTGLALACGCVLTLIGGVFAAFIGRRISNPVAALSHAAGALGRGEAMPQLPRSGLTEVDELARAMHEASQLLQQRAGESTRLEDELRRRAEQLETANRTKDEFLATVSHELRSPLNAMLGWSHVLKISPGDQAVFQQAIETIQRNARLQAQLIDDLLDVSRIIAGKLRIEVRPVDLEPVLKSALDVVRPAAEAKRIELCAEVATLAGHVRGDADRLQQVIWNLLSNAIKFTPRGGRVEARLEGDGPIARVVVRDTGQGISPDFLPHVFDRFRQADAGSTRKHAGLGLGLAIVRHLVELQGGTVRAESGGDGCGAMFTVELPLAPTRIPARDVPGLDEHGSGESLLDGLRVLVVDDEPDAREVLHALLARSGANVQTAATVAEALERLGVWPADVLVSDLTMPGDDGFSLIRSVRSRGARLPAVALTAQARAEDRARALLEGYQLHVPKPVEAEELIAVVASLAGRTAIGRR